MNTYFCSTLFCGLRKIFGRFYFPIVASVPSFIGSFMAIGIERPSRRATLAFYVTNVASEALFRKLVSKGYLKAVPYGEVLIFTASIATLVYMIQKNVYKKDALSIGLKFLIDDERKKSEKDENLNAMNAKCCTHEHSSCYNHVLKGFTVPFVFGWMGSSLLATLMKMRAVLREPRNNICCLTIGTMNPKLVELLIKILYSVSTAQVFYSSILEPRFMRKSYMKFLDQISDQKLHAFNRQVLDLFGTEASKGYEQILPDLNPQFLSRRFKETIFIW
ncbi:transmembrane protein 135-like protein, partial [Dinothrombium tinctorium]